MIQPPPVELLPEYAPLFERPPRTRYFALTGGRASGKSWHLSMFLANLLHEPGQVILFTRYTMRSAEMSILPEFENALTRLGVSGRFSKKGTTYTHKASKSYIYFSGIKTGEIDNTAKLKSIPGLNVFVMDEAEDLTDPEKFDDIDESVRQSDTPNTVIAVMNPTTKRHWLYQRLNSPFAKQWTHIHTTYLHNIHNLDRSYLDKIEIMKQANPARYRWKMLGHWLEGEEGLLWTEAMIAGCGVDVVPPLTTRIVAVDPAVTATAQSDETGIILLGKGTDGRVYVLGDYSGRYSPAQWGGIVKDICLSESVDMVVAEKNQGGDLVSANLRNCGVTRPVQLVTATKGKLIRAEPVYALYEQGKIKHAKGLGRLESQMITFNPAQNENSPDRVDALVWGVTKLALTKSIFAV